MLIAAIALAVDSYAYRSFHAPKNYALITLVPLAWAAFLVWKLGYGERQKWRMFYSPVLVFTWLEGLLVLRLAWTYITNPALAWHPSDLGFWILLALTALALLSRQLASGKRQRVLTAFLRGLWILGALLALIGLWQYAHIEVLPPAVKTFMIGTIGSANGYGSFLALALAAGTADLLAAGRKHLRLIAGATMMLVAIALILNGSRGAMLGLIATGAFLFFMYCVRRYYSSGETTSRRLQARKHLAGIAIALALAVGGIGWGLYEINPESAIGRLMMWEVTLPMIEDRPIFGIGQGRYADEYLIYQAAYLAQPEHEAWAHKAANIKQAHNEYLQAFAESGIPGGLLFLAVWGLALLQLLKRLLFSRHAAGAEWSLAGLLLVVLVHALVDAPLHVLPVAAVAYAAVGFGPFEKTKFIRLSKTALAVGLIVVVSAAGGLAIYKTATEYPGYRYWKDGVHYADQLRWEWAIRSYEQALRHLPEKGELQFHLGAALSMDGDYARGSYYLEEALNSFSDRNLYLTMAYAQLRLGNYEEAQRYALLSHRMFPDHLTPYLLLGRIYYRQERFDESKAALRKCIRRNTRIQSPEVAQVARDARRLWKQYYGSRQ